MTNAYSELYLDDAMENLGSMVDYAVGTCGLSPDEFMNRFVSSGIAERFERGNPKYVAGMSGVELAELVLETTGSSGECRKAILHIEQKGQEYWSGWILAYYQWITGKRFEDIFEQGLPLSQILSMYILHEADVSKFVDVADEVIERNKKEKQTMLQRMRKARGFSQKELSEASGVSLRMIQLYEQKQNDISKAQAGQVVSLARALGCDVEDLIG
ncbi:MAG: helix-turn-helix transcriptional regulator [Lachnospiraceae bacterium]|nr:helix-turn-helix transcriptional regulator [Lachnospiraceae bacterium]